MRDLDQLVHFHRALADFCRMGMPLGQAFREVAKDLAGGRLRAGAEAMAADVEAGASLADAYRKRGKEFPPVYAALLEAGAASGDLPGTLEEIARHAARRAEADARVRRALTYPVIMLILLSAITWFLFEFIVPQFGAIFPQVMDRRGNPLELPALTRFLLGLAGGGGGLLLGPAALAAVLLFSWLRRPMDGVGLPLGIGWRLPFVGPMRLAAELGSFASVLEGLLRRGLPGDRALLLAGASAQEPALRAAAEAAAERVRGGSGLADAVKEAGILPPSMAWLVGAAERRGEAGEGMAEVARLLDETRREVLDRYVQVISPAFQVCIGFLVFVVVLGVMYPIFALQRALL